MFGLHLSVDSQDSNSQGTHRRVKKDPGVVIWVLKVEYAGFGLDVLVAQFVEHSPRVLRP